MPSSVPDIRVRLCNSASVRRDGEFVLYWMIAQRRATWNFSLQRAADWAEQLDRPLVVLEALRCNYRWASDRLHRFIIDGMRDNAAAFRRTLAAYYAYVEPQRGAGTGLLEALMCRACLVVTDDFPCFFLPGMVARVARNAPVCVEAVDSNGLLPLAAADKDHPTAFAFRRFLQKNLPPHLTAMPQADPLAGRTFPKPDALPADVANRWPAASEMLLRGDAAALRALPIDHGVGVVETPGGATAARLTLRNFIEKRLELYAEQRSEPEVEAASGLSPYLHFGHIAAHEVFATIATREEWSPQRLSTTTKGTRAGWWNMSASAESFLDEFITWRELGYNMCRTRDDYDRFESLPDWAQRTLDKHANDPRQWTYSLEQFERAQTHDRLWNAAQTQLLREGRMHNYLRMLWGKKILEWSRSPREALATMIELNNKYALDGRNPNSYSGIFWVLGRYDRPWGPERPIFGVIRYMSSDNTARKFSVDGYVSRYADGALF